MCAVLSHHVCDLLLRQQEETHTVPLAFAVSSADSGVLYLKLSGGFCSSLGHLVRDASVIIQNKVA